MNVFETVKTEFLLMDGQTNECLTVSTQAENIK